MTGNAKGVQAPQHGSFQVSALGLRKQFLENPDGRPSRTRLKSRKQEAAVGRACSRHPSKSLYALLYPALAREANLSTLLSRLPSLWPLGSPGRRGRDQGKRCFFSWLPPWPAPTWLLSLHSRSPLLSGWPSPYHSVLLGSSSHAFPLSLWLLATYETDCLPLRPPHLVLLSFFSFQSAFSSWSPTDVQWCPLLVSRPGALPSFPILRKPFPATLGHFCHHSFPVPLAQACRWVPSHFPCCFLDQRRPPTHLLLNPWAMRLSVG